MLFFLFFLFFSPPPPPTLPSYELCVHFRFSLARLLNVISVRHFFSPGSECLLGEGGR